MGTQSITHPTRSSHAPLRIALLLLLSLASPLNAQTASVSALTVPLILPSAIVFDSAGNLYLAETANHVIRKVDTTGHITTIAGTGTQGFSGDSGPATAATLDSPQGLALDTANNLYIADTHNHRIRKLNLTTGTITTFAGTGAQGFSGDNALATAAHLNLPTALAIDVTGNLYLRRHRQPPHPQNLHHRNHHHHRRNRHSGLLRRRRPCHRSHHRLTHRPRPRRL